jgi:polygalacturonase
MPEYESRAYKYTPLAEFCAATRSLNTASFYFPCEGRGGRGPGAEEAKRGSPRPRLFTCVRCTNLLVEQLTFRASPSWTINTIFSEQLVFRGLTIEAPIDSPNTDAFDLESCRNVSISDCTMATGDDLVTIKSGTDEVGRRMGKPTENVTVTNCTMLWGHGAIVPGSETAGGTRNVSVSNCVFRGTDRGFRLKTQDGRGGVVDGLVVSNIVMQDVYEPFRIHMYYNMLNTKDPADRTSTCHSSCPRG